MIYVFNNDGVCLEKNILPEAPPLESFQANYGEAITLIEYEEDPWPNEGDKSQFSLVGGEVQGPAGLPTIFCHIAISGGDGLAPVGIANDGTSGANVIITLREGEDPESALFNIGGVLISRSWRVPLVKGDKLSWATVNFVDSVATGVYRTTGEPGLLQLAPERLDPVTLPDGQGGYTTYQFAAVGDTEIIISEELAET